MAAPDDIEIIRRSILEKRARETMASGPGGGGGYPQMRITDRNACDTAVNASPPGFYCPGESFGTGSHVDMHSKNNAAKDVHARQRTQENELKSAPRPTGAAHNANTRGEKDGRKTGFSADFYPKDLVDAHLHWLGVC